MAGYLREEATDPASGLDYLMAETQIGEHN